MGISYPDPGVIWTETPGSPSVFRVGRMIIVYGDDNEWDDNYNEAGKEDWWPSDITVNNLTSLQFVFSDHRLHPCHPAHSSCRHLSPSCGSFSRGKVKSESSSWTNLSLFSALSCWTPMEGLGPIYLARRWPLCGDFEKLLPQVRTRMGMELSLPLYNGERPFAHCHTFET